MADGSDRCDVWVEWKPRARKTHKCDECGRTIFQGEVYRQTKGLYEGMWLATKQCPHCVVLADWLAAECGGYLTQGIVEDFEEHATEYRRFDLLRLLWGVQHGWVRRDLIMPIPKLPPTTAEIAGIK
jgi:hypothetical protein